jgi:hypothetical protein
MAVIGCSHGVPRTKEVTHILSERKPPHMIYTLGILIIVSVLIPQTPVSIYISYLRRRRERANFMRASESTTKLRLIDCKHLETYETNQL